MVGDIHPGRRKRPRQMLSDDAKWNIRCDTLRTTQASQPIIPTTLVPTLPLRAEESLVGDVSSHTGIHLVYA
jgi:hypothetical protein